MIGRQRANNHRGTSMIEVIISTLLIGLVMVGALDVVGGALLTARLGSEQIDGRMLAASLMAEILAMPYEDADGTAPVDFGIESDEPLSPANRAMFDDLDDYRNWTETPPTKNDGSALVGASGWTRSVEIKKLEENDPTQSRNDNASDKGSRRVTVTATSPGGETTLLQAIRCKVGAMEQSPAVDATYVTQVGITLDAGGTPIIDVGTRLINHATGP